MTKPFVGQGWAKDIEPIPGENEIMFCHMKDDQEWDESIYDWDNEDHPDMEYELEKAEYWHDPYTDIEESLYDKYGEPMF